jgi:hypothetical protein
MFPKIFIICWPLSFIFNVLFIVFWLSLEKKYSIRIKREKYSTFPLIKDIKVKVKSISDKRIKAYLRVLLILYYAYMFLFFFPLLMIILSA